MRYYHLLLFLLLSTLSLCAGQKVELSGVIFLKGKVFDNDDWGVIVKNEGNSPMYIHPDVVCLNIEIEHNGRKGHLHLDFGSDSSKPFEELSPGETKEMGCLLFPDISLKLKDVGWCTMPLSYKKTEKGNITITNVKLIVEKEKR